MLLTEIYLGAENLMRQIAKHLEEDIPSTHHSYARSFDWVEMSRLLAQADPLLVGLIVDAEAFSDFLDAASR